MKLQDLNTDCLLAIFSHLTYEDLCQAALVNKLFLELSRVSFKNIRSLALFCNSLEDIRRNLNILKNTGSKLISLTVAFNIGILTPEHQEYYINYFKVIGNLQQLKSLSILGYIRLSRVELRPLLRIANHLEYLDLRAFSKLPTADNNYLEYFLRWCKKLKHLVIRRNSIYKGKALSDLPELQVLELDLFCYFCSENLYIYNDQHILDLRKKNKNVKIITYLRDKVWLTSQENETVIVINKQGIKTFNNVMAPLLENI